MNVTGSLTGNLTGTASNASALGNIGPGGFAKTARLTVNQLENNSTLESGLYTNSGDGLINGGPVMVGGWWHVLNLHHFDNNGYNAQLAVELASQGGNRMFIRTSSGGVWRGWQDVLLNNGGTYAVSISGNAAGRVMTKNVDGVVTVQAESLDTYHVEATKAKLNGTVPLDMAIVDRLCRDVDGCEVVMGMRDWDASKVTTSRGPKRLFMSMVTNSWRMSDYDNQGTDGDGVVTHLWAGWDCYFTDGEYVGGAGVDNTRQLGLMNGNWNGFNDPNMVCTLDIRD